MQINAKVRWRRNILTLVAISIEVQASRRRGYQGVPRFVKNALKNDIWAVSAGFFHPEFAPALRADITVDQGASIGVLEQRAVAALLITLWGILVCNRGLAHFRGCLLERQQHNGGPCRAPCATQENDSPRQCGWLDA